MFLILFCETHHLLHCCDHFSGVDLPLRTHDIYITIPTNQWFLFYKLFVHLSPHLDSVLLFSFTLVVCEMYTSFFMCMHVYMQPQFVSLFVGSKCKFIYDIFVVLVKFLSFCNFKTARKEPYYLSHNKCWSFLCSVKIYQNYSRQLTLYYVSWPQRWMLLAVLTRLYSVYFINLWRNISASVEISISPMLCSTEWHSFNDQPSSTCLQLGFPVMFS